MPSIKSKEYALRNFYFKLCSKKKIISLMLLNHSKHNFIFVFFLRMNIILIPAAIFIMYSDVLWGALSFHTVVDVHAICNDEQHV